MNDGYIIYYCERCSNEFIVFEICPSNCPYCKDKGIKQSSRYSNIKECMKARSYEKVSGRVRGVGDDVAKPYAKQFYNSSAWLKCREM